MFDGEFVTRIKDICDKAATPQKVFEDDHQSQYYVGGEVRTHIKENPRKHRVDSLLDLVHASELWGQHGILWHDIDSAVLICDDGGTRNDTVSLRLPFTSQFQIVSNLKSKGVIPHRDLLRLLRTDLLDVFPEAAVLAISQLEVGGSSRTGSSAGVGRERGVSEFQRELLNANEIPSLITAVLPVYDEPSLRSSPDSIMVSLDVDLETCGCRLQPVEQSLKSAIDRQQSIIHKSLEESGLPVFRGSPR